MSSASHDVASRRAGLEATILRAALDDCEERFDQLFGQQPVGAALIGCDLRPMAVNPALCALLGRPAHELVGTSVWAFTHPEDTEAERELVAGILAGGRDRHDLDARFLRGDGTWLHAHVTTWLIRDADGEVRYGVATVEDLGEHQSTRALLAERERQLRLALDATGVVAFDTDVVSGVVELRASAERAILGDAGDLLITSIDELGLLFHPDDRERCLAILLGEVDGDEFEVELRVRFDRVAQERWLHVRGGVVRAADGTPLRVGGMALDVSTERRAELERLEVFTALRETIEASSHAFVAFAADGRITGWNAAASSMLGWSSAQVQGRSVLELVPERLRAPLAASLARIAGADGQPPKDPSWGPIEVQMHHADGRELLVEASGVRVILNGAPHIHMFVRDVSRRRDELAELRDGVLLDQLTGLPNRALLVDRLRSSISRLGGGGRVVGAMLLDLDRFKVVNDSLGHAAGDAVLATLGARIRRAVPASETVGRFGGDEFVVVAEVDGVDGLLALAAHVLDEVRRPVAIRDQALHLDASIGIAVAEAPDVDAEALVRDAEVAMYRAKAGGGRSWELFDTEMRRSAMVRLTLENELRAAMEAGELEVHYQPLVTPAGALARVEALVRWRHPERGLISPAEFIPVAEDSGLVVPLGAMVLREACAAAARWRAAVSPPLTVSVNLSARQLVDPNLPDLVAEVLEVSGLEPAALCLELTETSLMRDPARAATTLDRVDAMGVRLAIDDFGTGYSSLLYLRRFPVSVLKLDRCFVAGLGCQEADRVIIRSIVDLAHALGLEAVAEGVETVEQRDGLAALGCDLLQGHLYGPAMPADELEALLAAGAVLEARPVVPTPAVPAADTVECGGDRRRVVVVDDSLADRILLRAALDDSGA